MSLEGRNSEQRLNRRDILTWMGMGAGAIAGISMSTLLGTKFLFQKKEWSTDQKDFPKILIFPDIHKIPALSELPKIYKFGNAQRTIVLLRQRHPDADIQDPKELKNVEEVQDDIYEILRFFQHHSSLQMKEVYVEGVADSLEERLHDDEPHRDLMREAKRSNTLAMKKLKRELTLLQEHAEDKEKMKALKQELLSAESRKKQIEDAEQHFFGSLEVDHAAMRLWKESNLRIKATENPVLHSKAEQAKQDEKMGKITKEKARNMIQEQRDEYTIKNIGRTDDALSIVVFGAAHNKTLLQQIQLWNEEHPDSAEQFNMIEIVPEHLNK